MDGVCAHSVIALGFVIFHHPPTLATWISFFISHAGRRTIRNKRPSSVKSIFRLMFTTTQVHLSRVLCWATAVSRPAAAPKMFGCFFGWRFLFLFSPFSHGRREAWNVGPIAFATVLGSCAVARMLASSALFSITKEVMMMALFSRDWGKLFFLCRPPHFFFHSFDVKFEYCCCWLLLSDLWLWYYYHCFF